MGVQENGNKYRRMDAAGNEEDNSLTQSPEQEEGFDKSGSTRKYVLACAFFASLNSVLLGYGISSMPLSFYNCSFLDLI